MVRNIIVRVELFKENDQFVSLCPKLNVSSFGDTEEEAIKSLKEALSLFFEECDRIGTLRDVLEEVGFQMRDQRWVYREPLTTEKLDIALTKA